MSLHHQAGQASRHGKGISARGRSGRWRHRHRRVRRRRRARSARRMSTPPPCSALPKTRAMVARGKLRMGRRLGARAGLGRACRGRPGTRKDRVRIRYHSAAQTPESMTGQAREESGSAMTRILSRDTRAGKHKRPTPDSTLSPPRVHGHRHAARSRTTGATIAHTGSPCT